MKNKFKKCFFLLRYSKCTRNHNILYFDISAWKYLIALILNKAFTLHLKQILFISKFIKNKLMLCGEVQNVQTLHTHFCPAGNHPGTLLWKVTQSVNKSHGLYKLHTSHTHTQPCKHRQTGSSHCSSFVYTLTFSQHLSYVLYTSGKRGPFSNWGPYCSFCYKSPVWMPKQTHTHTFSKMHPCGDFYCSFLCSCT